MTPRPPPRHARPAHGVADADRQGFGHDRPLSTKGAESDPAAPGLRILLLCLKPFAPRMKTPIPEIHKKSLESVKLYERRQVTTMARPHGPDHHLRRNRKGGAHDRPSTDRRDSIKQGTGQTQARGDGDFEI